VGKLGSLGRAGGKLFGLAFLLPISLMAGVLTALHLLPKSDESIRQMLVERSVAAYTSTGAACPCPYSLNREGHRCTVQNAHSRSDGAIVLCYPDDVSDATVLSWRATHE
jgi:hypothetical protein